MSISSCLPPHPFLPFMSKLVPLIKPSLSERFFTRSPSSPSNVRRLAVPADKLPLAYAPAPGLGQLPPSKIMPHKVFSDRVEANLQSSEILKALHTSEERATAVSSQCENLGCNRASPPCYGQRANMTREPRQRYHETSSPNQNTREGVEVPSVVRIVSLRTTDISTGSGSPCQLSSKMQTISTRHP